MDRRSCCVWHGVERTVTRRSCSSLPATGWEFLSSASRETRIVIRAGGIVAARRAARERDDRGAGRSCAGRRSGRTTPRCPSSRPARRRRTRTRGGSDARRGRASARRGSGRRVPASVDRRRGRPTQSIGSCGADLAVGAREVRRDHRARAREPSPSTDQTSWIDWFQNSSVQKAFGIAERLADEHRAGPPRLGVDPVGRVSGPRRGTSSRTSWTRPRRPLRRSGSRSSVERGERRARRRRRAARRRGPRGRARSTSSRAAAATTVPIRIAEEQRARVGGRDRPRAVEPLEDREPERVGVEVLVVVVRRRGEEVPDAAGGEQRRRRVASGPRSAQRAVTTKTTGAR